MFEFRNFSAATGGTEIKTFLHWKNCVLVTSKFLVDDEEKVNLVSTLLKRFETDPKTMIRWLRPFEAKKSQRCGALERKLQKPNYSEKGLDLLRYINWLQLSFAWDCMLNRVCCMEKGWNDGLTTIEYIDGPTDLLELKHRNLFGTTLQNFQTVKQCRANLKKAKELFDKVAQSSNAEKKALMKWMGWSQEEYEDALNEENINLTELYFSHYYVVETNHPKVLNILTVQLKHILKHKLLDKMFMQFIYHATDISTEVHKSCMTFTTHHGFAQSIYALRVADHVLAKYENDPHGVSLYSAIEWKALKGTIKLIYVQHFVNLIMCSKNSSHLLHQPNFPKFDEFEIPKENPKHENLLKVEADYVQAYKLCWQLYMEGKELCRPKDPMILKTEVSMLMAKECAKMYLKNVPDHP